MKQLFSRLAGALAARPNRAGGAARRRVPRARLQVERLEGRDVPSYMVMDVPGHGVYLYNDGATDNNGTTGAIQLVPHHANALAVDHYGNVVASLPGYGTYVYGSRTYNTNPGWHKLVGATASALAISSGNGNWTLVGMFPGYGVYEMKEGYGWRQLANAANRATILDVSPDGDVVAEFPGRGVWYHYYFGSNWQRLTGVDVTLLDATDNWVVVYAPGHGVARMSIDSTTPQPNWQGLTGHQPTALAIDGNGDVVGNFPGYGIRYYDNYTDQWNYTVASNAQAVGMVSSTIDAYRSGWIWIYDTATETWRRALNIPIDYFAFEH